jgi:Clr5 domain
MATPGVKWANRAPQAPPILHSEWEKHKTLLCELRPTMTLEKLMEIMSSEHKFNAS